MPDRIALSDPYYTLGKKYLNNQSTAEKCNNIVKKIKVAGYVHTNGVGIEMYKTSLATSWPWGDTNEEMSKLTAYTRRNPNYAKFWDFSARHRSSYNLYFLSYNDTKTYTFSLDGKKQNKTCVLPNTSTNDIRLMMNNNINWHQISGQNTQITNDDIYQNFYNNELFKNNIIRSLLYIIIFYIAFIILEQISSIKFSKIYQIFLIPTMKYFIILLVMTLILWIYGVIYTTLYTRQICIIFIFMSYYLKILLSIINLKKFPQKYAYIGHMYYYIIRKYNLTSNLLAYIWYYLTKIFYVWILLMPITLSVSVLSNKPSLTTYKAIYIDATILGILLYIIAITLEIISSIYKKQEINQKFITNNNHDHSTSFYEKKNDHHHHIDYDYEKDAFALFERESKGPNNFFIKDSSYSILSLHTYGIWKYTDFPQLMAELMLIWSLYFISLNGFIGANYWFYRILLWVSALTTSFIIILDHCPKIFFGKQQTDLILNRKLSKIETQQHYQIKSNRTIVKSHISFKEFSIARWFFYNWSLDTTLYILGVIWFSLMITLIIVYHRL